MPRKIRLARCHRWRVTGEPCTEPATHEVLDPCHYLLCEEHAQAMAEDPNEEDWLESESPEQYARECEEAAGSLFRWMRADGTNPVTYYILEEALDYLELYELGRARPALLEAGGEPQPTERELEMLRFFEECAQRYGWTDEPGWVTRVREWRGSAGRTGESHEDRAGGHRAGRPLRHPRSLLAVRPPLRGGGRGEHGRGLKVIERAGARFGQPLSFPAAPPYRLPYDAPHFFPRPPPGLLGATRCFPAGLLPSPPNPLAQSFPGLFPSLPGLFPSLPDTFPGRLVGLPDSVGSHTPPHYPRDGCRQSPHHHQRQEPESPSHGSSFSPL